MKFSFKNIPPFRSRRLSQHRAERMMKLKKWKDEQGTKKSANWLRYFKTKKFKMIGLFAVVVIILAVIFVSPLFEIRNVILTSTNQDINKTLVKEFIEPTLMRKNLLFLSSSSLKDSIYKKFDDVSVITISRKPLHTVEIDIKGYPIVAVIKHRGKRYYINKSGVVIPFDERNLALPFFEFILTPDEEEELEKVLKEPSPSSEQQPAESESEKILKSRIPFEPAPPPTVKVEPQDEIAGKKIISESELNQILRIIELIEENFNFKITFAKYIQIAREIHLSTSSNFTILLDAKTSPESQLQKLKKAQEVINFDKLERIDLSIEGKRIYYVERE